MTPAEWGIYPGRRGSLERDGGDVEAGRAIVALEAERAHLEVLHHLVEEGASGVDAGFELIRRDANGEDGKCTYTAINDTEYTAAGHRMRSSQTPDTGKYTHSLKQ